MSLIYRILWFENSKRYISSLTPLLEDYLGEKGLDLEVRIEKDDRNIDEIINSLDVNLILLDYNLNQGKKGDKLLKLIRNNELYTEAIIYSVQHNYQRQIRGKIEGVYFSRRRVLEDKVKKIIDVTIKKYQDIDNQRGVFIAGAIDIINQVEEIILKVLQLNSDRIDVFKNRIMGKEFYTDYQKYRFVLDLLQDIKKNMNKVANGGYEKELKEEMNTYLRELNPLITDLIKMEKEVIIVRNKLAHSKKDPNKKNALLCRTDPKIFDEEQCIKTRKDYKRHSANLEKIIDKIENYLSIDFSFI